MTTSYVIDKECPVVAKTAGTSSTALEICIIIIVTVKEQ